MSQNPPSSGAGRLAHMEELRRLDGQIATTFDINALKPIYFRLEEIGKLYPADAEMMNAISVVRNKMVAHGQRLMDAASGVNAPPPSAATSPQAAKPGAAASSAVRTPSDQIPAATFDPSLATPSGVRPIASNSPISGAHPPTHPSGTLPPNAAIPANALPPNALPPNGLPPNGPLPPSAFNWKRAIIVGGVIGALIAGGGIYTIRRAQQKAQEEAANPGSLALNVRTKPAGASIRVNGEVKCVSPCSPELPLGVYEVQAVLPGFEPASTTHKMVAGIQNQVDLVLEPQPLSVRFYTDLTAGKVELDGAPAGDLQDGQLILDRITPGAHSVKVSNDKVSATFSFESQPGKSPVLTSPVAASNVLAIVVANAGKEAKLVSSANVKVSVDGSEIGQTGTDGLVLNDIAAGDRQIALNDGAISRDLLVSFAARPTLTAWLKLDLNAGSLVVVTGEDDVSVLLNNIPMRKTRNGEARLAGLNVRDYLVRVVKDGFQMEGPPKTVKITKGQESRVEFKLKAIPKLASLRIKGAAPGITIMMDGQAIGLVGADGAFQYANVPPGEHQFELRRDKFQPKRFAHTFKAGDVFEPSGSDLVLSAAPAMLRVNLTPANATLTIRRQDDAVARPFTAGAASTLPEGTYVLVAKAPNFQEKTVTVQVVAGDTKVETIALATVTSSAPKPTKRTGTMADWDQAGEWLLEDGWYLRNAKGGSFVTYGITPTNGVFTFNYFLKKGKKFQWFINYTDQNNYILFYIDKKNFVRKERINGRDSEEYKAPHNLGEKDSYALQIDISGSTVRHMVHDGTRWNDLDSFSTGSRNLTQGKFGVFIPRADTYGLNNFRFAPR